jgi:hypothetical protein
MSKGLEGDPTLPGQGGQPISPDQLKQSFRDQVLRIEDERKQPRVETEGDPLIEAQIIINQILSGLKNVSPYEENFIYLRKELNRPELSRRSARPIGVRTEVIKLIYQCLGVNPGYSSMGFGAKQDRESFFSKTEIPHVEVMTELKKDEVKSNEVIDPEKATVIAVRIFGEEAR